MLTLDTTLQNRYRILRQLGQGGMGTVYEAVDERFESQVALKETHFTEEILRKQFEREARLLNKLRHPAMTRVIDYFSESGGQFLVMDYIHGEDLGEMLERNGNRPFPLNDVLSWGDQLLDALDYIHSQEPPIVHRDIKPQNLKLTERNRIILLDFGLAKGSVGGMTTVATTRSVLGYSLSYAPLEQILKVEGHWIELLSVSNAEQVEKILANGTDPRSDLYSLAATLLHLMTGKAPPNAPTRALSMWSGRPDSLYAAFGHGVTRAVGEVLEKAMSLTLDKRFASASEMREALRDASRPTPTSSKPKTETLPPTIVDLLPTQSVPERKSSELPSTVASPSPTELAPKPDKPITSPASSQPRATSPALKSPLLASLASPTSKPNRLPWLIGGVAVLLLLSIIVIAINYSKSSNAALENVQLVPFRKGDKFGFSDTNKKIIIDPKYDAAYPFSQGLAIVVSNKKSGVIDKNGREIVPPKYDYISQFSEGLASVSSADKHGFIDMKGNEVIPLKYEYAAPFSEGLAFVGYEHGFIDHSGNTVLRINDYYTSSHRMPVFSDGLLPILNKTKVGENTLHGYMNQTGKIVIPLKYEDTKYCSEGLCGVRVNKKEGFIDTSGNIIIEPKFDYVGEFSDGLAAVYLDDKVGFINKEGKIIIPLKYDMTGTEHFVNGLAHVKLNNKWAIIDKTGSVVIPFDFNRLEISEWYKGFIRTIRYGKEFYIGKDGTEYYEP